MAMNNYELQQQYRLSEIAAERRNERDEAVEFIETVANNWAHTQAGRAAKEWLAEHRKEKP